MEMTPAEVSQTIRELVAMGLVRQVGTRRCPVSGRVEPVWGVNHGAELEGVDRCPE